jgi:transposase
VSGFNDWDQKSHCESYLLYPKNIGAFISIDEVCLSQGEMYTFVTVKSARGKQGTILASIKGTR